MKSLKLYVVSSHVDKPIEEKTQSLRYEILIQAGAALTDKRICELNDFDGFEESISDRNRRYSECTAIYWIGKHVDSDYVGIEHYRRRFACTENELEALMDSDADIVTTKPLYVEEGLRQNYINNHYGGDWVMMFDLLKRYDPDNYTYYKSIEEDKWLHYGNLNIMKGELFKAYCEWVFPMVDEYYKNTPEKMDKYNRRDAGFLMERLTHFFVMRMKREGKKVVEKDINNYARHVWVPTDECDVKDIKGVYDTCNRLYMEGQITKCCNVLGEAMKYGADKDTRLVRYSDVLLAAIFERANSQTTMYEYLPYEMKENLDVLADSYEQLKQMVDLYTKNQSDEMKALFINYLQTTGYSTLLVNYILETAL